MKVPELKETIGPNVLTAFVSAKQTGHEVAGGRKQWQRRILGDDHTRSRP